MSLHQSTEREALMHQCVLTEGLNTSSWLSSIGQEQNKMGLILIQEEVRKSRGEIRLQIPG